MSGDSGQSLIVQLSDLHLGADWAADDPAATVARVIAAVRKLPQEPDAVLVTGDLAEHATDGEYEQALELLAPLDAPTYVLPGNHDDRGTMRRHFDIAGDGDARIHYVVDLGRVRIVMLDTIVPGEAAGALDAEQLAWLNEQLTVAPNTPTLLAMHHLPLRTGIAACDRFGLASADQDALRDLVEHHRQVRLLIGGHFHLAMVAEFTGRPAISAPSTYAQAELDFAAPEMRFGKEPIGFAVHALKHDDVVSYLQAVR